MSVTVSGYVVGCSVTTAVAPDVTTDVAPAAGDFAPPADAVAVFSPLLVPLPHAIAAMTVAANMTASAVLNPCRIDPPTKTLHGGRMVLREGIERMYRRE
jgi:hypothetical protein